MFIPLRRQSTSVANSSKTNSAPPEKEKEEIQEQKPKKDLLKLRQYLAKEHNQLHVICQKMLEREIQLKQLLNMQQSQKDMTQFTFQDKIKEGKQLSVKTKEQNFQDVEWNRLNELKIKLEAKIDIQKSVIGYGNTYEQTSRKMRELVDQSLIGARLKTLQETEDQEKKMRNRRKRQNVIISLNKKVKENNVLQSSHQIRPLTIQQLSEGDKKCSIDNYITNVLQQQENQYGYNAKTDKFQTNLSKDLTIFDYLNENSWGKARLHAESQMQIQEKHRQKLHKTIEENKCKISIPQKKLFATATNFNRPNKKLYSSVGLRENKDVARSTFTSQMHPNIQTKMRNQSNMFIQTNSSFQNLVSQSSLDSARNKFEESQIKQKSLESQLMDSLTSPAQSSIKHKHKSSYLNIVDSLSQYHQQNNQITEKSQFKESQQKKIKNVEDQEKQTDQKGQSNKFNKFQVLQMQVQMFMPANVEKSLNQRKHQAQQLTQISRVVNRLIQPHDPYLQSRFEKFHKSMKKMEENQHQKNLHRSSKSQAQLVNEFLNRRGINYQQRKFQTRSQSDFYKQIACFGNASSQNISQACILDLMQKTGGQISLTKDQPKRRQDYKQQIEQQRNSDSNTIIVEDV